MFPFFNSSNLTSKSTTLQKKKKSAKYFFIFCISLLSPHLILRRAEISPKWKTGKNEKWYKLRLCCPLARNDSDDTSSGLLSTKQEANVGRVWCEDRKSRPNVMFFRAEKWRRCSLPLHHNAHFTPASLHDPPPPVPLCKTHNSRTFLCTNRCGGSYASCKTSAFFFFFAICILQFAEEYLHHFNWVLFLC